MPTKVDYTADIRTFLNGRTAEESLSRIISFLAETNANESSAKLAHDIAETGLINDEDADDQDVDHVAGRVSNANYAGNDTGK